MKKIIVLLILFLLVGCGNSHEGQSKTLSSSDWSNVPYQEVKEKFEKEGFTNVKTEGLGNLITGWLNDEGDTKTVQIVGYDEYPSSKWIDSNTEIIIQYYSFDKIDNDGNVIAEEKKDDKKQDNKDNNESKKEDVYDIDENVVVVMCEKDDKYDTQYNITFANLTLTKYYTFDSSINPRQMGDSFHAIGDLPTWFDVGEVVHLQCELNSDDSIKQSKCIVTEKQEDDIEVKNKTSDMPVISGLFLDDVLSEAKNYGVSIYDFGDDNGDGTTWASYHNESEGLSIDICYSNSTNEIVYASIYTDLRATVKEQEDFIIGMSKILCPSSDSKEISNWVSSNIGSENTKVLNGIDYKVWVAGSSGCYLYDVNITNWENWSN